MPRSLESLSSPLTMGLLVYWLALVVGTHTPMPPLQPDVSHYDKLQHFLAYGVLTMLAFYCLRSHCVTARICVWGLILCLPAAAAIDEITQILVPGRNGDRYDWIADVLGIAFGMTLCVFVLLCWSADAKSESSSRGTE